MKFSLGQKVNYVRVDPAGEVIEAEGNIFSYHIGVDGWPNYMIRDKKGSWNIDEPAINTTPEERQAYVEHVLNVRARADEINASLRAITTQGNDEIALMNGAYLGSKIILEPLTANDNV